MTTDATTLALLSTLVAKVSSIDAAITSLKDAVSTFSSGQKHPAAESVSACSVTLPSIVNHDIRKSPEATRLFIDTLRRVGQYMCCKLTREQRQAPEAQVYLNWKLHHLYEAFVNLHIIDAKTTHEAFAALFCLILPDRKPSNLSRGFYRNFDNNDSVIRDIEDEFRPVILLAQRAA